MASGDGGIVVVLGPGEVREAANEAVELLGRVVCPGVVAGSRKDWAGAVSDLQRVIDVASAAQDAAIVRLASIEAELAEDGTAREVHRAPGHVALDAPAILSGALRVSAVHAERRVRSAVRLAADGPGAARETGLGGLHVAMSEGRVDSYRASVVAQELEEAPPDVAAGVVAAVEPFFDREDGPRLRRRCRRVLVRVSPDLLRQRAVRARAESGCAGGWTTRGWTGGRGPSPRRTPRGRGPRSTHWASAT